MIETGHQRYRTTAKSIVLGVGLAASLLGGSSADAKDKILVVRVANPTAIERVAEMVSLDWKKVRAVLPSLDPATTAVFNRKTHAEIVSQCVDENADGVPDQLIFQVSLKPNETQSFTVRSVPGGKPTPSSLVDARFVEPRQDLAWENDRIAFRMYGPALAAEVNNGVDVWTKRVRYLIVQKWYKASEGNTGGKDSYHEDHGEGADFFSVGRTLGCGGSGIWHQGKLYQPGVFSTWKIIADGPLRAIFQLTYDSWNIEEKKLREVRRVTLDAGQNLNRFDVTYTGAGEADTLLVACGLVKRKNTSPSKSEARGWISLWGATNDDPVNGDLGTGVVVPKIDFAGVGEDNSQHLIFCHAKSGKTLTYFAGAGWTRSGDFATAQDWNKYLDVFARTLQSPLRIDTMLRNE